MIQPIINFISGYNWKIFGVTANNYLNLLLLNNNCYQVASLNKNQILKFWNLLYTFAKGFGTVIFLVILF